MDINKFESLISNNNFELTQDKAIKELGRIADKLYLNFSRSDVNELETYTSKRKDNYSLLTHLAIKLTLSKKLIAEYDKELKVSVVFAMYKEHQRILTQEEHPYGENFLVKKAEQLNWLFNEFPNISWKIYAVDDGCPEGSGTIAQQIIRKNQLEKNVEVLFLKDAIDKGLNITKPMISTSDSQKGGSIEYGMWHAAKENHNNHIIIFTDADLSTDLGQTGLLLNPILNKESLSVIGSRRESKSIVIKKGIRNTRGKLFIYLWKMLLPDISYITDTQCGFKAFDSSIVNNIVKNNIEKRFAFDIELLLKTEKIKKNSISKKAIAWIDSEEASTTTDLQPYLPMLKAIAKMYQKYHSRNDRSDEFAIFISNLDESKWNILVDNIPKEIANGDPVNFSEDKVVSIHQLESILAKEISN